MERYIKQLLAEDSRVIIPQFGCINSLEEDGRTLLSFNPYLNYDDGKLTSAVMAGEGLSEDDAKRRISDIVDAFNNDLNDGKSVTINGIGTFCRETDGRTDLMPNDEVSLAASDTDSSFAAPAPEPEPVAEPAPEPEQSIATPEPEATTEPEATAEPEQQEEPQTSVAPEPTISDYYQEEKSKKPLIVALVILLLLLIAGLIIYFHKDNPVYKYFFGEKQPVEVTVPEPEPAPADTVKDEPAPAVVPPVKEEKAGPLVAKPLTKRYNVIVGSYRDEQVAIKRVEELNAKGFDRAFVGIRKNHFVAVIADFANITEAENMQEQIVEGQYHIESWITNSGE